MRKLLLAGAATFGLIAAPAVLSAQETEAETSAAAAPEVELDPQQRAAYDAWPADRRADYDALERTYQAYYWTLNPQQQDAFSRMTAEQRAQIVEAAPQARSSTWTSIETQMASRADPPASPQATPVTSGAGAIVRDVPADAPDSAVNDYPVCTAAMQDNCQNAGEGGAPGKSRALPHWPGEPASERN